MKLKQLESILEDVETFEEPDYMLEQYKTSAHLAAHVMFAMAGFGDVEDKVVVDFGCGTGMLAIASQVMDAGHTVGLDIDPTALAIASRNVEDYGADVELINCDLLSGPPPLRAGTVDTVVMNPPFGTRVKGADMAFLKAGYELCTGAVYSLHKSSTRAHIRKTAAAWGANVEVLAQMKFDIPQMYKFHRKKSVDVDVDFIRVSHPEGPSGGAGRA